MELAGVIYNVSETFYIPDIHGIMLLVFFVVINYNNKHQGYELVITGS
jgi:hypothetical protein